MVGVLARNKLTAKQVQSAKSGKLYDGGNLLLDCNRQKSWLFRYTPRGTERDQAIGLGNYPDVSLAQARGRATELREVKAQGLDPKEYWDAKKAKAPLVLTFAEEAADFIRVKSPGWATAKHAADWAASLNTYCAPINLVPVCDITTELVMQCVEPLWLSNNKLARDVRNRIEQVLTRSRVLGHRVGDNPAAWKGNLKELLPTYSHQVQHLKALEFGRVPAFMKLLRARNSVSARALEFTILTAARTSETLGMTWGEVDIAAATWIIPANRMKGRKEHRVALSVPAVAIVKQMRELAINDYVFPGARTGRPLSGMAMLIVLKQLGYKGLTVHGFRSSFRDWAAETTNFANIVCEMALAHSIKDGAEKAYRRGDLLEKRKKLMESWAYFIESEPGQVVPIGGAKQESA